MKTQLLNYPKQKDLIQDRLSSLLGLNFKDLPLTVDGSNLERENKSFSQKEKLRIVYEGQTGRTGIKELCLREGISTDLFHLWTRQFLFSDDEVREQRIPTDLDDDRFHTVQEVLFGECSVAEICRREGLTIPEFRAFSREFLLKRRTSDSPAGSQLNRIFNTQATEQLLGPSLQRFLESYIDFQYDKICISKDPDSTDKLWSETNFDKLICLYRMNDLRWINKHFEAINAQMKMGDVLVGCMETFSARKERSIMNKIPVIGDMYFGLEFVLKRIFPKVNGTKGLYFNMTKGKNRLLSKAEALGRLVSCGFSIMDHVSLDGFVYFIVKKEKEPVYDMNPSYGPIYGMPRLGKNGKIIKVFKLRTMHPYSEYLQDYIVKAHGYAESGKPANDFRIPKWGKTIRRLWLDEIPQLYNFLKGELKLVGIRPVSERYFQDIPKEMQKLRLTQKPGCIPPYVSLNRSGNVMSVLQAEKEYLEQKIRNPYTTDTKFFLKALFNILVRHKRSA